MNFEVGSIHECRVTKIAAFGAFVTLDGGKNGLVHISEISSGFVRSVGDFLHEGDTVRAKIISIDEKGRLALSIKETEPPPSETPRPPTKKEAPSDDFEERLRRFMAASNDRMSDLGERGEHRERRRRK